MVSSATFLPNNHPKVSGRMENQWKSMKMTCHVPHPFLILNYQTGEFLKVIWSCQKTQPEDVYGSMVQWSMPVNLSEHCQVQSCENQQTYKQLLNKHPSNLRSHEKRDPDKPIQPIFDLSFGPTKIWSHKWYSYLSGQSVKSRQPLPQRNPWKNPWKTAGSVYQHHQPSSKTRSPASVTITWLLGLGSGSPRFGFCRWKVGCFGSSPSSNCSAPPAARSVFFLSLENFLRTNNFGYWKGIGLNFKFFALP